MRYSKNQGTLDSEVRWQQRGNLTNDVRHRSVYEAKGVIKFHHVEKIARIDIHHDSLNNSGDHIEDESTVGCHTFTNTTGKATIVPVPDESVHIGQRLGLSNLDVAKINRLYNCSRCSTIIDAAFGSLKSANYPRNYSDNINCVWLIRTRSRKISLHFRAFQLRTTRGCQGDYVKVYDGSSKYSAVLMDKTCGSRIPTDIVSSGNLMLIEFVTDSADTASGFQATFTSARIQRRFNIRN
ncbi:astacin-like metalloendopeptidase [Meleagris gallopavo]|uniref:astacin-like metalloendopeptidase n=1 Tax=Meleagris gallopavo TaxID=9103 RepID=UPI00093B37AF|nr:astacin-like metalloendopeptidase [Meleagris gallopavo]